MNSLGTTPYVSTTERENKDFNYQNLETSQSHSMDSSLYNRGDQDVFSLSHLKHVAPSSNISGMVEPSPISSSLTNHSSDFFSGEETKPLLSDYKQEQPLEKSLQSSSTIEKTVPPFEKDSEIKDDKGEITTNYLATPAVDKTDDTGIIPTPPKISTVDTVTSNKKDYGTISSSTNPVPSSSSIYKPSSADLQVAATGEGATKTLKQVGNIIQSQAQTLASSIRNNVNSDNIFNILIDGFLVLVIAVLLYFGIW